MPSRPWPTSPPAPGAKKPGGHCCWLPGRATAQRGCLCQLGSSPFPLLAGGGAADLTLDQMLQTLGRSGSDRVGRGDGAQRGLQAAGCRDWGQQGHGAAAVPETSEGPCGPGSCRPGLSAVMWPPGRAGSLEREEEGRLGGGIGNWPWAQVGLRAGWALGAWAFLGQTWREQIGLTAQEWRSDRIPPQ